MIFIKKLVNYIICIFNNFPYTKFIAMKHQIFILLFLLSGFCSHGNDNNNSLYIKIPSGWWSGAGTPGNITDIQMDVTPQGLYAQVQLTFTINIENTASTYRSSDLLESVLFFDLPAGSFIHDSWLWLDDATIIAADVVEREQAIETYTGIVRRQRDPSLLINTLPNNYRLNVFPVRTDYARKVRIVYSTPFTWQHNRTILPLPVNIFRTSSVPPAFSLTVHTDTMFGEPSFLHQSFSNYIVAQTPGSFSLQIPAGAYSASDMVLAYKANTGGGGLLYTYPTGAGEGVYQFVIPATTAPASPRNVVFILHPIGWQKMSSYPSDMLRVIKNSLLADFDPVDSFAIFYADRNNVAHTGNTWHAADSATIHEVLSRIPHFQSDLSAYIPLLKAGLAMSESKPGAAQTILWSGNTLFAGQHAADSAFTVLDNYLGGITNRIDVINLHPSQDNNRFYQRLCRPGGGSQYRHNGTFFDDYVNVTSIDLDASVALRQILYDMGQAGTGYSVTLPVNGITANVIEPVFQGKYTPRHYFSQVGSYYGTWPDTGSVEVTYVTSSGLQTTITPLKGIYNGNAHTYKSWVFNYLRLLKAYGARSEIIDSCISNRLLFDYTAFLALETGDTLKVPTQNEPSGGGASTGSVHELSGTDLLKVFPNPFTGGVLTIQCPDEIATLQVLDLTGRLVMESAPGSTTAYWDGKNAAGQTVSAGIYMVIATDRQGKRYVARVMKE